MTHGWTLLAGTLPVLLFLAALRMLDSYRLVRPARVLRAIAAGAVVALVAWALHALALDVLRLDPLPVRRYLAPGIEEALKLLVVARAIRAHRVGFLVDAALYGFAVGAGFALAENLYFSWALATPDPALWIARGFGTAILHGAATGVAAILMKHQVDRTGRAGPAAFAPGWLAATLAHSLYNHTLVNPLLATALLLVAFPALVMIVFERSERATRHWLGTGLDGDLERLEQILNGSLHGTPVGDYLDTLRERFEGPVLADMLCLLRLQLELSLRAKGQLIARAAGYDLPIGEDERAHFAELEHLERVIGPTGRLALQPLLPASRRELWQKVVLGR